MIARNISGQILAEAKYFLIVTVMEPRQSEGIDIVETNPDGTLRPISDVGEIRK